MANPHECEFCGTELNAAEIERGVTPCKSMAQAEPCEWFDRAARRAYEARNAAPVAKSDAGRKSPPKGVVGVRPIHMGEGKPGMVVVRIGDDNHGTNTALEASEAYELAAAIMGAGAVAEVLEHVPDELADKIAAAQGEVRI